MILCSVWRRNVIFRLLPEDLQDFVHDIVYTNFKLTEREENIIEKYAKIAESSKLQVNR